MRSLGRAAAAGQCYRSAAYGYKSSMSADIMSKSKRDRRAAVVVGRANMVAPTLAVRGKMHHAPPDAGTLDVVGGIVLRQPSKSVGKRHGAKTRQCHRCTPESKGSSTALDTILTATFLDGVIDRPSSAGTPRVVDTWL